VGGIVLFAAGAACAAPRQDAVPATPAPAAAPPAVVTPSNKVLQTYKIQRDDTLSVTVLNAPEVGSGLSGTPVLPDGTISLPYVGTIKVIDRTLADVREDIRKRLSRYYVRPQVTVIVAGRTQKTMNVLGTAVTNRGKVGFRDGWRLLDVLASIGAPSDRFELFTAELIRASEGRSIPIDLARVYANDPAANIEVEVDDILRIDQRPERETQVIVIGAVAKPGPVTIPRNGSLIQLFAEVGPTTPNALLSKVTIDRNGQTTVVDLRGYVETGVAPEGLPRLEPGDRVVVPENKAYYYMIGAVGKPGLNVIPDDRPTTVAKSLLEGALPVQSAEWKKTFLIRPQPDGTNKTYTLDVETMIKTGDFSKDMPLLAGDSIYVPFKRGRKLDRPLADLSTVGFAAGGIFGLNNVFRLIF
jgi:polysaccharide export outer membrane protein